MATTVMSAITKPRGRGWQWNGRELSGGQLRLLLAAGFAFVSYKSVREALTVDAGIIADREAGLAVAVVLCASLLLCRRLPVAVAVVTTAGFLLESQMWPALVALYNLTVRRPPPLALALTGAAVLPVLFGPVRELLNMPLLTFMPCSSLLIPLAFGLASRNQRDINRLLARRLDDLAAANRLRDDRVRLAERARIAREMHDVLAHRLSLLVLHSGVLQRRGAEVSEPVQERLGLLRDTSARALDDLRSVLGALRDQEGPVPLAPTADDLPALIAEAETAGTRVRGTRADTGDLAALPATVRFAVHRIVQEALTNARKHAPGKPVDLTVAVERTQVEVRAENACPVVPEGSGTEEAAPHGYGLVGVAERVAALKGEFTAGFAGADRFLLHAVLPVTPRTPEPDAQETKETKAGAAAQ
ncbi:sensor histidine kinase [Streptomyces sp. NPDC000878]